MLEKWLAGLGQQIAYYFFQFRGRQLANFFVKDREHQVGAERYCGSLAANYLVKATPDTVTYNSRLANLAANDDRGTVGPPGVTVAESETEHRPPHCLPALVDAAQAAIAVKTV